MNENLFAIKDGSCREKQGIVVRRILAILHFNGLTLPTFVAEKLN